MAVSKVDNHAWAAMSEEGLLRSSGLILTHPDTGKEGITLAAIWLFDKDSNLPHGHGELQLNKFESFPKKPLISKIFREIGYADELGSVMRNTNKYTKLHSGGTPVFVEHNIFEIVIPMENVARLQMGPKETNKET